MVVAVLSLSQVSASLSDLQEVKWLIITCR